MSRLQLALLATLLVFGFSSCISISSLETARVVEPKKFGVGIGTGLPNYSYKDDERETKVVSVVSEISWRYGLVDQLDLGLNLKVVGLLGMDLKYQFLGDATSLFAAAAGFEAGYFFIPTIDYNDANTFETAIPLFFSYHPTENFAVYINPKYIYRKYGSIESTSFIGGVGGLRIGKSKAGFIEYAYLWNGSSNWSNQRQINIGFARDIR